MTEPHQGRPQRIRKAPDFYDGLPRSAGGTSSQDPIEVDDHDPNPPNEDETKDTDYRQQAQHLSSHAIEAQTRKRRSKYENMTHAELVDAIKRAEAAHDYTRSICIDIKKKRAEDRKAWAEEKATSVELRKINKHLEQRIATLKTAVSEQTDRLRYRTERFATREKELLEQAEKSVYLSLPDDVICDKFRGLWNSCRDWVRTWGISNVSESAMRFFEKVMISCIVERDGPPHELLRSKLHAGNKTVIRALSFASLSRELIDIYLKDPFAALGVTKMSQLNNFYEISKSNDLGLAHAWRAETLRIFRTNSGLQPLDIRGENIKSAQVTIGIDNIAQRIIDSRATIMLQHLQKQDYMKRHEELVDICRGFCLLAVEMWSQKSTIEVSDREALCKEPFSINSELQQPHMSMGMEEDDETLDGVLPHVIVSPAIHVLGDSDGKSLDQSKVVSRSIVFIFRELLPSKAPLSLPKASQVKRYSNNTPENNSEYRTDDSSKRRKLQHKNMATTDMEAVYTEASAPVQSPPISGNIVRARSTQQVGTFAAICGEIEKGNTIDRLREKKDFSTQHHQTQGETKLLDPQHSENRPSTVLAMTLPKQDLGKTPSNGQSSEQHLEENFTTFTPRSRSDEGFAAANTGGSSAVADRRTNADAIHIKDEPQSGDAERSANAAKAGDAGTDFHKDEVVKEESQVKELTKIEQATVLRRAHTQ